jgi:Family of unknown function (DUF6152)
MRIRRISRNAPTWLWAAAWGATATPCAAHHSFTIFDFGRNASLSGTVKEFQWNNPHCFIQLLVAKDGATQEWSIEMGSPMHLLRHGLKPKSLNPGDKVTVVIHPMRDGTNGGDFVSATAADGTSLGS